MAPRLAAEQALGQALRRAARLTQALTEAALAPIGLSFAQWVALRVVVERRRIAIGDLAREIDLTSGAVTRMIDTLEARALVRRMRTAGDRRVVRIAASAAGDSLIAAARPLVAAIWSRILADLSCAEVATLTGQLGRLAIAPEPHGLARSGDCGGVYPRGA